VLVAGMTAPNSFALVSVTPSVFKNCRLRPRELRPVLAG
jgi:hypothetical protein